MYKVIPNEEDLIKKYDDARTKYKIQNAYIQEDLSKLSAMLEIKLILRYVELKQSLQRYEMDQVNNGKESEWKLYEEVKYKLTVITVLRYEMKF